MYVHMCMSNQSGLSRDSCKPFEPVALNPADAIFWFSMRLRVLGDMCKVFAICDAQSDQVSCSTLK